jgi:predicted PurR-regulated permease PerM
MAPEPPEPPPDEPVASTSRPRDPGATAPGATATPDTPTGWAAMGSMPQWLPRAIVYVFLGVVLLAAGSWLITRLHDLLLTLVVALFLSFALEPAVDGLARRGWRRGSATALVLVVLLGTLAIFFGLIGKLVVDQLRQFIDQAPSKSENLERWINQHFGTHLSNQQIRKEFNDPNGSIHNFATHLAGNALGFSVSALEVVFRFFTILLFTFYLVADGPRFRRVICSFLRPDRQREVLANWEIAIQKTGGYLYSRLLLGVIQAVFHYVAFVIIGVPYPLALAIFVGVVSQFVPVIGTYVANGFPALVALSVDPVKAVWVVVFAVVFQQIENYLMAPRITARTMSLHPAVAFGAVLAGAGLFGPIGALIALPVAAVIQAVGSAYFERHEVVESRMTAEPRRRPRLAILRRAMARDEEVDSGR